MCLKARYPELALRLPARLQEDPSLIVVRQMSPSVSLDDLRTVDDPLTAARPRGVHVLELDSDLDDPAFQRFRLRFGHTVNKWFTQGRGPTARGDLMSRALEEMVDNVLLHASIGRPGVVGYEVSTKGVVFGVFDLGVGASASLNRNPANGTIGDDRVALAKLIEPGVTGSPDGLGGNGYGNVFEALADANGMVWLRSGTAVAELTGVDIQPDVLKLTQSRAGSPDRHVGGFQVVIGCRQ